MGYVLNDKIVIACWLVGLNYNENNSPIWLKSAVGCDDITLPVYNSLTHLNQLFSGQGCPLMPGYSAMVASKACFD